MSVLEQFRDAEERVAQRLKELEPMVAEYRELEGIAQRLGLQRAPTSTADSPGSSSVGRRRRAPAKSARGSTKATSNGTRARARRQRRVPGQRDEQLLELVRTRPGITVAEAGKALGVDPTGLYRVVQRLQERGDLVKHGRALEPTSATPAG